MLVVVVLTAMIIGVQVANYIGPGKIAYSYKFLEDIQPLDLINSMNRARAHHDYRESTPSFAQPQQSFAQHRQQQPVEPTYRRASTKSTRRVSETLKKIVAHNQRYSCAICRNMLPPSYQVDHIVPLYVDVYGIQTDYLNSATNLQALCPNCHSVKTQHDLIKYKEYLR
jgi:5-methylcytosine-specific restriction endonuclease McrA